MEPHIGQPAQSGGGEAHPVNRYSRGRKSAFSPRVALQDEKWGFSHAGVHQHVAATPLTFSFVKNAWKPKLACDVSVMSFHALFPGIPSYPTTAASAFCAAVQPSK